VVVATSNAGKLREISAMLADPSFEMCSLEGLGQVVFPEEGDDYEANAIGKARAVAEQLGEWAVADDSGLEVAMLGGRPGVHSARYGGALLDDAGRVKRLLHEMAEQGASQPANDRSARFVCVAVLATPDGRILIRRGECPGRILGAPRGVGGFGYDPIFQPEGQRVSMAELGSEEKDRISHRGRAFEALRAVLLAGD